MIEEECTTTSLYRWNYEYCQSLHNPVATTAMYLILGNCIFYPVKCGFVCLYQPALYVGQEPRLDFEQTLFGPV